MSRRLFSTLLAVLFCIVARTAAAHDFFIMPDSFRIAVGDTVKIGFHSADGFPDSTTIPKRLQGASLHTANGVIPIQPAEDGKRMAGTVNVPTAGHVILTVVNAAATETMRPAAFLDYIKEEGLSHIIESRTQRGEADKPARERYTMYAKSILLAGEPSAAYSRPVGSPIEIVPEKDPYSLKGSGSLPIRVLVKGNPAANVQVMAASTAAGAGKNQVIGRTDAQGRLVVPVQSGKWRLHALQMERSSSSDADWESLWATLTFEIP